jgi:antitoxin component YwqK of YwqJK toxin-antitoxin module
VNAVQSSKKIRDLLKIEKSTCAVMEESPGYVVESWTLPNGQNHREHGPAFIDYYQNGQFANVCYYLNGEVHREDGPACVFHNSDGLVEEEYWHSHGKMHRADGPAAIRLYNNEVVFTEYYLNGIKLEKADWERELAKETAK